MVIVIKIGVCDTQVENERQQSGEDEITENIKMKQVAAPRARTGAHT